MRVRVTNLSTGSSMYTSNAYLVRGNWNALEDLNTLVDVGRDPGIVEAIRSAGTGVGKRPVEQVVLTHGHFDHVSALPLIREAFEPIVYAFTPLEGVDRPLVDGQELRFGDREFEVIHTPGHSPDSVCFYCGQDATIFVGDAPLLVTMGCETYGEAFLQALERIGRRRVEVVYPGHGRPQTGDVGARLRVWLERLQRDLEAACGNPEGPGGRSATPRAQPTGGEG